MKKYDESDMHGALSMGFIIGFFGAFLIVDIMITLL